jgi:hypothetical protein
MIKISNRWKTRIYNHHLCDILKINPRKETFMDLQTTGYAAGIFQENPKAIRAALRGVQAEPPLTLNGLEYFHAADVLRAIKLLAEHDAKDKIEAAKKEVADNAE